MGEDSKGNQDSIFKGVTYYIVGDIGNEVTSLLDQYGAKRDPYLSEMVSHVIADSPNSDDYSEAKELFELPIVTRDWVILSVKCGKQLPKEVFALEGLLFSGVVACPWQLDPEDVLPIWGMIVYHGGCCQLTLDKTVTHLITSSLEGPKFECAKTHAEAVKMVTPDWVGESISKSERQKEELYHPELVEYPKPRSPTPEPEPQPEVDMEITQAVPVPTAASVVGPIAAAASAAASYFEPMDVSPQNLLAQRQQMYPAGGRLTPKQLQYGGEERPEAQRPDTPGSAKEALARKISSRIHGKASSEPTTPERPSFPPAMVHRSLSPGSASMGPGGHSSSSTAITGLRFSPTPLPGLGMGGVQSRPPPPLDPSLNIRNTLRNITNRAAAPGIPPPRQPLPPGSSKNAHQMNHMAGAGLQPRAPPPDYPFPVRGMAPLPHHAAGPSIGGPSSVASSSPGGAGGGTPAALAASTSSVVGTGQSPSGSVYFGHDPKENVHPELCLLGCIFCIVDYHSVLGNDETSEWKKVIEKCGGQIEPSYCHRVTHVLCSNQKSEVFKMALKEGKRVVSAFWLNDCLVQKKMVPPWQALHLPLSFNSEKPGFNQMISVTNFDGEERARLKQMINAIGAKYTGYMTRHNSALICKKSGGMKFEKAKEWRIAVVNVQWLSDLVLGNMDALRLPVHVRYLQVGQGREFHMDLARVTHLMGGWKTPVKIHKELWKKMGPTLLSLNGQENSQRQGPSPPKRQKVDVQSPIIEANGNKPKVLFTLYPTSVVCQLQNMVKQLGGVVVTNPRHCTHLVCPALARTIKFFVAINTCRHVVTREWLEDSFKQSNFLDEAAYALKDTKAETTLDLRLAESLNRAHAKPLFQGLTFYITPSIVPPVCELVSIIESAGGSVVKKRPSAKQIMSSLDDKGVPKIIIITCLNDLHLSQDLRSQKIAVFNAEFVLTGVLRQEVDYNIYRIKSS